jgi:hypothetical protein
MKNLILSAVAVLLFVNNGIAQQYTPMPTSDARTAYVGFNYGASGDQFINYLLILNGEDTVIRGKTFKKIMIRYTFDTGSNSFRTIADYPDKFYAGIREENKKVYVTFSDSNGYLPKGYSLFTDTSKDRLLYDFNAMVGDTIPAPGVRGIPINIITVTAIDSVLVGSQYHKVFKTSEGPYIIEGIGTTSGLFYYESFQHTAVSFSCFSHGQDLYPANPDPSCYYIHAYNTPTSISNTNTERDITVYPNPFTDELTIEANGNITIYNSIGQVVLTQELKNGTTMINTSDYPQGLYHVILKNKEGNITGTHKIIHQ